jgi:hypothetical protein
MQPPLSNTISDAAVTGSALVGALGQRYQRVCLLRHPLLAGKIAVGEQLPARKKFAAGQRHQRALNARAPPENTRRKVANNVYRTENSLAVLSSGACSASCAGNSELATRQPSAALEEDQVSW